MGVLTRMSSPLPSVFHGADLVRSTATRGRWGYSVEIAERISVGLWPLIYPEQPTQAVERHENGTALRHEMAR